MKKYSYIVVFMLLATFIGCSQKNISLEKNYKNTYLSCFLPNEWEADQDFTTDNQTYMSALDYNDVRDLSSSIEISHINDYLENHESEIDAVKQYHLDNNANTWDFPYDFDISKNLRLDKKFYNGIEYQKCYVRNQPDEDDDHWRYKYLYYVSGNDLHCLIIGYDGKVSETNRELSRDLESILGNMEFFDLK